VRIRDCGRKQQCNVIVAEATLKERMIKDPQAIKTTNVNGLGCEPRAGL
jgi:hypothetical protein